MLQPVSRLDGADIACLLAFWTCGALEGDALIFGQALETVRLNVLKVREQVATAAIRGDKAKTFGIVKPFYCAGLSTHFTSS